VKSQPAWRASGRQPSRLGQYGVSAIRNCGVVWPVKASRSGLPYSSVGWQWRYNQGVRSIVTFIKNDSLDYSKFGSENGLRIPLPGEYVPTPKSETVFLQLIQDPMNWPVPVHCAAGKDPG
jgi:hypothetical protein